MASQQMRELVERMRTAVPLQEFSVEVHRERVLRGESLSVAESDVEVEPLDAGGVPGEWIRATGASRDRVLLMAHHGAFIAGTPASLRVIGHQLSNLADVSVLSLDYRLAPEHQFPAAIDDLVRAYTWLVNQGISHDQIAVGGASAGGGVAAGALLAIRDAGLPPPAASILLCPFADLTLSSDAATADDSPEPIDSRDIVQRAVALYLGTGDPLHPWASPARADLSGLPPLHVEAASADRLVDDAQLLVERATACGVDASLHVSEGAIHNFAQYAADLPESVGAIRRFAAHLDEHLVR
ncbi:alpha/beta hydrolase fold domain-containing protein [Aeromicrobium panaciterrae]|uniref:alpha/beta hydrolase fold domain-containing protein n=1 Tax=Aeromicrobium panaciterrae TaxID=363861 RepID=UPI0031E02F93